MNKYLKQLIEKYEQTNLWDLRALKGQKAMLMPLSEWLDIFNNPLENGCFAAYRTPDNSVNSFRIQGVLAQNKEYFCYEGTPRYTNVCGFEEPMTFVFIDKTNVFQDAMGYSNNYLYLRSRVPESHKKTFSLVHTNIIFKYVTNYANFDDILGYDDFINRYTDENGAILCKQKAINKAIDIYLKQRLKNESDFLNIEWTLYSEDEPKFSKHFYVDNTKSYTNKFTKIILDGGIYEY